VAFFGGAVGYSELMEMSIPEFVRLKREAERIFKEANK
jgi:hypothetical protein